MMKDKLQRFVLETPHVRGEWVHLDNSWQTLLERSDYPPTIRQVLGEALGAIVLLSATIKHKGSLILQIRSNGPIHLLVAQATPEGTLRGLARWSEEPQGQTLPELFGEGHLAITMEAAEEGGKRYQGIIALEGDSITQALEQYFQQSEQLPTRLWLTSNAESCAGFLLQRMPDSPEPSNPEHEDWQRVSMLLDTLTTAELQQLAPEELIYRLFHEETPRLFNPRTIQFYCSCGQEKVENMVYSLGQTEAESIIQEQQRIEVTCEFCNASYHLDSIDVARLFADGVVTPDKHSLH